MVRLTWLEAALQRSAWLSTMAEVKVVGTFFGSIVFVVVVAIIGSITVVRVVAAWSSP